MKRWLKHFDHVHGGIRYEYVARPADRDDRDGSDVRDHYHGRNVLAAERDGWPLPPLVAGDLSYPAALAAFYE